MKRMMATMIGIVMLVCMSVFIGAQADELQPDGMIVLKTIPKQMVTIREGSYVRSGPGSEYEKLGSIVRDSSLEFMEEVDRDGETWYKIEWYGYQDGYVHSSRVIAVETKEETVYAYKGNKYVTFGAYEQDNDTSDGKEPIDWLILDYDEMTNRVLVISRYVLDKKPYHVSHDFVTWETCSLRDWLNNVFINEAFSEEEQEAIPTVPVSVEKLSIYDKDTVTEDRIFVLSTKEARAYLSEGEGMIGVPTLYSILTKRIVTREEKVFWWLRSPGYYGSYAAEVNAYGYIELFGEPVDCSFGIRPALWIDLNLIP